MKDIALTEWEHQPHVLNVLTSREMGAWLGRRDNRLLQEIRDDLSEYNIYDHEQVFTDYYDAFNTGIHTALIIIDKHIKEIEGSDTE